MTRNSARTAGLLASFLLLVSSAKADWINLTGAETANNIAEITVRDNYVHIALEIYPGDLGVFKDLVPDEWLDPKPAGRPSAEQRLEKFSREVLTITDGSGTLLTANIALSDLRMRKDRYSPFAGMINPFTKRVVPSAPEDKRVIYFELEYPFSGDPSELTFSPPVDEDGNPSVSIGFIAYHKSVPITDFRYLSTPSKLFLDWDDPWYTQFENANLRRHHQSPVMSFLYVDPREIRHEILFRVRDLADWIDLPSARQTALSPEDQPELLEAAEAFFAGSNPMAIDGETSLPHTTRAEFLKFSLRGIEIVEEGEAIDVSTAIIGVILSYPIESLPKTAEVSWELFNEKIQKIPATSIDPAGPLPGQITPDVPGYEWKNFLLKYEEPRVTPVVLNAGNIVALPVAGILLLVCGLVGLFVVTRSVARTRVVAGIFTACALATAALVWRTGTVTVSNPLAGPPQQETASEILDRVLTQVNIAHLETREEAFLQALANSVSDQALDQVRTEINRAMAINVAGGGIAKVSNIENLVLEDIQPLDDRPGFRGLAQWTATLNAAHWGHNHQRTRQYRAQVELTNGDGPWKIDGITIVDVKEES